MVHDSYGARILNNLRDYYFSNQFAAVTTKKQKQKGKKVAVQVAPARSDVADVAATASAPLGWVLFMTW